MVRGGLTTRTSTDLVEVVRALAAIFHLEFVTPELVLIASEKVLAHRLVLVDQPTSVDDEQSVDDDKNIGDQVVSEDENVVIEQKSSRPRTHHRQASSNSFSWTGKEREDVMLQGVETGGVRRKVEWVTPADVVADVLQVVWPPV